MRLARLRKGKPFGDESGPSLSGIRLIRSVFGGDCFSRNGQSASRIGRCHVDADYFANVVLVSGDGGGIQPEELYRVLQPCTGRMYFPGAVPATRAASLEVAGIPATELVANQGVPYVARGPLDDAFDWNSPHPTDQRLRWPLSRSHPIGGRPRWSI